MADRETLGVYGAKAADYSDLPPSEPEQAALSGFLARLPAGAHILDLGCGPGAHAAQMQAQGFAVTALDATPEFVDAARAKGVKAKLATFDDVTQTSAYHAIWASFSLLHAPKADFPRHLAAIHAALKPQGHLFLGLKLGEGEHRDPLGRFYAYFTEAELHTHLDKAGLTPIHTSHGTGVGLAGTADPFILLTAFKP